MKYETVCRCANGINATLGNQTGSFEAQRLRNAIRVALEFVAQSQNNSLEPADKEKDVK